MFHLDFKNSRKTSRFLIKLLWEHLFSEELHAHVFSSCVTKTNVEMLEFCLGLKLGSV